MSRYIDAEKLKEMECADCYYHTEGCPNDCGIMERIDDVPTADVVSREQYNECYEECLRLRKQNEFLMQALNEKEDNRRGMNDERA